jgi:methionyl-tRNA formyltransferase
MATALAGDLAATPQPAQGVTLAPKISKAEARLDFTRPASALERAVRAFNPAPGAWCEIAGERIKILAAHVAPGTLAPGQIGPGLAIGTGDGVLQPDIVQRPGRPAMPLAALLNGWTLPPGSMAG